MVDLCSCNNPKVFRTSWTNENPGRRFKMCARYRKPGGCNEFEWVDPFFPRCQAIIPDLRRTLNAREDELVGVNAALDATKAELEKIVREKDLVISENLMLVDQLEMVEEHLKVKSDEKRELEMKLELLEIEWKLKEKRMKEEAVEEARKMKKRVAIVVVLVSFLWKFLVN